MCEFHKNDGSWCADNFVEHALPPTNGCFCGHTTFEYVREATKDDELNLPQMGVKDLNPAEEEEI
jgi:hypothetical protein